MKYIIVIVVLLSTYLQVSALDSNYSEIYSGYVYALNNIKCNISPPRVEYCHNATDCMNKLCLIQLKYMNRISCIYPFENSKNKSLLFHNDNFPHSFVFAMRSNCTPIKNSASACYSPQSCMKDIISTKKYYDTVEKNNVIVCVQSTDVKCGVP